MNTAFSLKNRNRKGLFGGDRWVALLFISPWIIGFILFTGGPIIASFILSFFRWKMVTPPVFVAFENYVTMFTKDALFWKSIFNTLKYVIISVPLSQVLALTLAMLLNQKIALRGVWRTIFYIPAVVSGVAGSVIWMWMYNRDYGIINSLLPLFGIVGPNWLVDIDWALTALIIKSFWNIGAPMVIYLAALQGLPKDFYEAADIDGAGEFRKFFQITIPLISPSILFSMVMGVIGAFQIFAEPYVMTSGGPDNSTLFLGLHLYNNAFTYLKMGYASAMAWVMFLLILGLTLIQFRASRKWIYYESE